ncbi:PBP1A family penicillin-binding protein [Weissella diestrammenae]|uniref:PBP1A family penicillin-binding protein n=1 Tax=Weissella diestrammenae TaxID=1162633 RepID=A0A7G9T4E3_9LACO|nr:PBP1A family penicillin-binding protein [Weissella diestrammenae]MCM0583504.1 PBP1A family penicillin-binding protein [Weissella diestrammenae]QNN74968.1 PBP1A family penicillin-binding protein [Weissella diestrammenae]
MKKLLVKIKQQWAKSLGPIWRRFQLTRWFVAFCLSVFLIISIIGTFEAKTTDVTNLKARLRNTTQIYDINGNKAGSLSGEKGTYVSYAQISSNVTDAVLATEDRNFYHEYGFSITGIGRALILNAMHKVTGNGAVSGGSTLTQQLVKNAFLSQEQTTIRKVRELFLAVQVEKVYSKHDILAMYLNNAYFGEGIWGIQDASQKYFGVDASQLSQTQGAMLAGMLQSPNGYNPLNYPSAAKARRDQVLQNLVSYKKMTQQVANQLQAEPINATNHAVDNSSYEYPYFFDSVIDEAVNKYHLKEQDIMKDGYKIYTTMNQKDQSNLQDDYANPYLNPIGNDSQGATVVLDARTGGVRAVVGGRGEHVFRGLNRATQIRRQPGSTIKPIVDYAPALSRGFSYDSKLPNHEMTFGTNNYAPKNYGDVTTDDVAMYIALEKSYNIPAVWVMEQIGLNTAYQAGIKAGLPLTKADKNYAMAIGGLSKGVSPLQMAQAYTSFANGGQMSDAHFITKIVDASGRTIVDTVKPKQTRLWSQKVANEMTSMMLGVYTNGTGVAADPTGYTVAGKTGTTEAVGKENNATVATDSWAIAYTPDIVNVTWTGYDNASQSISPYLSATAGPLMKKSLEQIIPNTAQTDFDVTSVRTKQKEQTSESNSTKDGVSGNIKDIMGNISKGAKEAGDTLKKGAQTIWNGIQGILGQ